MLYLIPNDCLVQIFQYASLYELKYVYQKISRHHCQLIKQQPEIWKYITLSLISFEMESASYNLNANLMNYIIETSHKVPFVRNIKLRILPGPFTRCFSSFVSMKQLLKLLKTHFKYLKSFHLQPYYYSLTTKRLNYFASIFLVEELYIDEINEYSNKYEIMKSLKNVSYPSNMQHLPHEITKYKLLNFDNNKHSYYQWKAFDFRSLTELDIPHFQLEQSEYLSTLIDILQQVPKLRVLNLNLLNISETSHICGTLSKSCLDLSKLTLKNYHCTNLDIMYLKMLPHLKYIRFESTHDKPILSNSICDLLANIPQLTHLYIDYRFITFQQICILYSSLWIQRLQINLNYTEPSCINLCRGSFDYSHIFDYLFQFQNRKSLDLSIFNRRNIATSFIIDVIKHFTQLHTIYLNKINKYIIDAICETSKKWKHIEYRPSQFDFNSTIFVKNQSLFTLVNKCTELEILKMEKLHVYGFPLVCTNRFEVTQLREIIAKNFILIGDSINEEFQSIDFYF